jgi:uncharacterized protein YjdB
VRSTFLFALFVSIGACGDSAGPPAAAAVASVTVTPDSTGVVLYDSFPLHATARDAHGQVLPNRDAVWSSSAWGIVWVRSNGVVQPLGRGGATITATIDGVQGDAKITVVVPINFIQLTPSAATVPVGETLRIRTRLFSMDGLPPTDSAMTWSSNDTTVANVVDGLVTGRQAGLTTIIAAAPGAAAAAAVRVIPQVASVTVSPSDTSLHVSSAASTRKHSGARRVN